MNHPQPQTPSSPPSYPYYTQHLEKLIDKIIDEILAAETSVPRNILDLIYRLRLYRPTPYWHNGTVILDRYPTKTNPAKPVKPLPPTPPQTLRQLRRYITQLNKHRKKRLAQMLTRLYNILKHSSNIYRLAPYIAYQLPVEPEHQARIMLTILATAHRNRWRGTTTVAIAAAVEYIKKHLPRRKAREAIEKMTRILGITKDQLANYVVRAKKTAEIIVVTDPQQYVQTLNTLAEPPDPVR